MFFCKKKRIITVDKALTDMDIEKLKVVLENLVDVSKVKIKSQEKYIVVYYENTIEDVLLQNTVERLGYTVTGIKESV